MAVNENIKRFRKEMGLTQKKLSELCGIAEPTIRRYEAGTLNPKIETVEKIASALGTTAFNLMGVEYWDKKYPKIAKESKEYKGFIDYLNSLGYIVKDVYSPSQIPVKEFEKSGKIGLVSRGCEQSGFVPAESHCLELIRDGKSFILEDDEFSAMLKDTKDIIALKLWQKFQGKK